MRLKVNIDFIYSNVENKISPESYIEYKTDPKNFLRKAEREVNTFLNQYDISARFNKVEIFDD